MVHHHELPELLSAMAERLRELVTADATHFSLYNSTNNTMQLHFWKGKEKWHSPMELPVEDSPSGWAWKTQKPLVVNDLDSESRFPVALDILRERGLKSYCWLPLTTAEKRLGALGLGSSIVNAYTERDMRLLPRIAQLIAVAVENALIRKALVREKESLQTLLEVNNTLVTTRDLQKLFPAISGFIRRMIRHDYASVAVYDEAAHSLSFYPLDSPLTAGLAEADSTVPVKDTPAGHALMDRETKIFTREDLMGIQSSFVTQMLERGIQSLCCIPLTTRKGELGTLNLASRDARPLPRRSRIPDQVAAQVAVALDNARAYREIAELTNTPGQRETLPGRGNPHRAQLRRDRRRESGAEEGSGPGENGCLQRCHRADPGRHRNRQGTHRSRDSPHEPSERSCLRQGELCRDSHRSAGERAFRS